MKLKVITDKELMIFLVAKGFDIEKIEKEKGRDRSLVYFEKSKGFEAAILAYVNKSDPEFTKYMEAEKRIKTLLCLQKNSWAYTLI